MCKKQYWLVYLVFLLIYTIYVLALNNFIYSVYMYVCMKVGSIIFTENTELNTKSQCINLCYSTIFTKTYVQHSYINTQHTISRHISIKYIYVMCKGQAGWPCPLRGQLQKYAKFRCMSLFVVCMFIIYIEYEYYSLIMVMVYK